MSIGVPIKVLHEAEGHIVTCETITGEVYRGKLIEAEDNMNCQMTQITVTYRDGRTANLENVYIRGSKIRFMILPDMLKNAPMFKKQGPKSGTAGRGKSAMIRAQSKCSRNNLTNFIIILFVLICSCTRKRKGFAGWSRRRRRWRRSRWWRQRRSLARWTYWRTWSRRIVNIVACVLERHFFHSFICIFSYQLNNYN